MTTTQAATTVDRTNEIRRLLTEYSVDELGGNIEKLKQKSNLEVAQARVKDELGLDVSLPDLRTQIDAIDALVETQSLAGIAGRELFVGDETLSIREISTGMRGTGFSTAHQLGNALGDAEVSRLKGLDDHWLLSKIYMTNEKGEASARYLNIKVSSGGRTANISLVHHLPKHIRPEGVWETHNSCTVTIEPGGTFSHWDRDLREGGLNVTGQILPDGTVAVSDMTAETKPGTKLAGHRIYGTFDYVTPVDGIVGRLQRPELGRRVADSYGGYSSGGRHFSGSTNDTFAQSPRYSKTVGPAGAGSAGWQAAFSGGPFFTAKTTLSLHWAYGYQGRKGSPGTKRFGDVSFHIQRDENGKFWIQDDRADKAHPIEEDGTFSFNDHRGFLEFKGRLSADGKLHLTKASAHQWKKYNERAESHHFKGGNWTSASVHLPSPVVLDIAQSQLGGRIAPPVSQSAEAVPTTQLPDVDLTNGRGPVRFVKADQMRGLSSKGLERHRLERIYGMSGTLYYDVTHEKSGVGRSYSAGPCAKPEVAARETGARISAAISKAQEMDMTDWTFRKGWTRDDHLYLDASRTTADGSAEKVTITV